MSVIAPPPDGVHGLMQRRLAAGTGYRPGPRVASIRVEPGKEVDVTTTAANEDRIRELEVERQRAWGDYSERLRDLSGDEYERAEHESWEQLQRKLRGLERRRASLKRAAA
jgi:hypothetical protein